MSSSMDDIPDTGTGITGRLLATEIRVASLAKDQKSTDDKLSRYDTRLERLFWVILGGSFAVMVTVISAALYVGGRLNAIENLDRRVTRLEDSR